VRFISTIGAFAALAMLVSSLHGASARDKPISFRIPAKPVADALVDFAMQARISISDSGVDFSGAASNPLDGQFTREDGLRRLLSKSGFLFRFVDSGSVEIIPASHPLMPEPQSPGIERVVVTASKVEEVAESAPHSISGVVGANMQVLDIRTTHDLTAEVAGLTATNLGPGEDKLFVRGLTDSVLPGLSESVVGMYMDDSAIAMDAPDPNLGLVDVDRVEVLRGPQGSLYGAGALTGVVRIVTREPVFDSLAIWAGAGVSVSAGGAPSEDAQLTVNLPLIEDQLALRLVGYANDLGGYVDEVQLHRNNSNSTRIRGFRAASAWQPISNWIVSAHLAYQQTQSDDSQYFDPDLGTYKRDNFLTEPHSDKFLLTSVSVQGSLGWADLVSNSAFVDRTFNDRFDATLAWPLLTGLPFGPAPFDYGRNIRAFTQETRLSSDEGENWQWLGGIFLSHQDEDFQSSLTGPGPSYADLNGRSEEREDRTNEAALFGQITYDFSEQVSISTGARAFDASHNVSAQVTGLLSVKPRFQDNNNQKGFAPQVTVAYKPDFDTTFYVSYSEGYRLGGLNVDGPQNVSGENEPTFDSDVLHNYEAGAKLRLLNGSAVANTAVYFADWRNVQTDQIAPDGAFYILNAGNVRDLGVELEISAELLENLHLNGNVFWNNAGFTRTNPLLVTAEGNLPGAPNVSVGIAARYDHPINEAATAFGEIEYNYVGSSHLGFTETTPAMGNYQLMNVRVGLLTGDWQTILFAENLTNDRGNTFAFGNPFSLAFERQITPPRPRTIGLSLVWAAQP